MITKLGSFKDRYNKLGEELLKPEIFGDQKKYKATIKEYNNLQPIVEVYEKLIKLTHDKEVAEKMLETETDPELKEMLWEEVVECKERIEELNEEAKVLLLPKDENDDKNVIMEIRSGAGGDEASLFGAELMRMYTRFAEGKRWKVEIIDVNETELGGVKEASFMIKGDGVYSKLKYESGVHRVQRVPETESQGRVHTSTATVAVLPEQEDVDIEVLDKDIKVDTYRASGAGGQHVNKTDSAIRITHLPTGLVVACQQERSQIKNRERAMQILKSKLYDFYKTQSDEAYAEARSTQIGTGDRSERIRTYNYPQGRLTDHRINYTVYNLTAFLEGDIEELVDNLRIADQKAQIENAK